MALIRQISNELHSTSAVGIISAFREFKECFYTHFDLIEQQSLQNALYNQASLKTTNKELFEKIKFLYQDIQKETLVRDFLQKYYCLSIDEQELRDKCLRNKLKNSPINYVLIEGIANTELESHKERYYMVFDNACRNFHFYAFLLMVAFEFEQDSIIYSSGLNKSIKGDKTWQIRNYKVINSSPFISKGSFKQNIKSISNNPLCNENKEISLAHNLGLKECLKRFDDIKSLAIKETTDEVSLKEFLVNYSQLHNLAFCATEILPKTFKATKISGIFKAFDNTKYHSYLENFKPKQVGVGRYSQMAYNYMQRKLQEEKLNMLKQR
ncbi:hypothetical protein [Helicobacter cetorum]|uniref:hypothetical protein n=1 Tax=Helicobacter cetorum TaxID=138563 RepID=UPI00131536DB|nr:hypothetical protein [Helicobacter cetorum]